MVELLISSDIAKYCEFRTITRVLTNLDGKLEQVCFSVFWLKLIGVFSWRFVVGQLNSTIFIQVPCSRSDVFSSKQVSMIEKRMLMKLLTFCLNYENEPEQYAGIPFNPAL